MTNEVFERTIQGHIDYCKNVLVHKGIEYNGEGPEIDRLQAFKTAAMLQGISPKEALAGMMAKHTVSVYDMCRDQKYHSFEKWAEKITDHINYLLLLIALIHEEEAERCKTSGAAEISTSSYDKASVTISSHLAM